MLVRDDVSHDTWVAAYRGRYRGVAVALTGGSFILGYYVRSTPVNANDNGWADSLTSIGIRATGIILFVGACVCGIFHPHWMWAAAAFVGFAMVMA